MKLGGIDGSQLFGFMTALGTHVLLDESSRAGKRPPPRMAFVNDFTALLGEVDWNEEQLVHVLFEALTNRRSYFEEELASACINKPADFTGESFGALTTTADETALGVLSGLACFTGREICESTLCAANGAGHQELVRSIRDVLALVQEEHLRAALFTRWRRAYEVPREDRERLRLGTRKPTLRLDPCDERLYALRATDPTPSSSTYKTELGAQALAIAAFSVLPVVPRRRSLTVSSIRKGSRVYFTWYLWSPLSTLATVRSLLFCGGEDRELRSRGVFAAFRAARVSGSKGKLSFTPSEGVW